VRELGIVLVIVVAIRTYQQRGLPSGAAPAVVGVTLDGTPVSLESYRGKPVLLHFWATWCGVCRVEQSSIDALARDLPVLTIASQSGSTAEVAEHVRKHGVKPRVIADTDNSIARRFGVHGFPTSFIVDSDGDIRHIEVGYTTQLGLRARMWLAGLW
jgi:thiol-disulfide isomerase/thioredoxin